MSRFHLRTLGELSLRESGLDGPVLLSDAKALAALAYLATTPDGTADRSHLALLLWPGKGPARARAGLRQALYYLRQKTPGDVDLVRADTERVGLNREALRTDLGAFEDALADGDWDAAVDLYGGAFLGGYSVRGAREFRQWRDSRDQGLRAAVREAFRSLVAGAMDGGETARAARAARGWVELNPLEEEAQEALIRSLVAAGDRVRAHRAYESYRSLLREELDESPGPRVTEAVEELRSGSEPRVASDGRAPGSRKSAALVAGGLAAGLLVLAVVGGVFLGDGGDAGPAGDGGAAGGRAAGTWFVSGAPGPEPSRRLLRLRIRGNAAELTETELPAGAIVASDGERLAVAVTTPEGPDVAVRDLAGGDLRRLTRGDADEVPRAWSPDGRWILYEAGRVGEGGRFVERYRIRGATGQADDRPLGLPAAEAGAADWSPSGTAIAAVSDSSGNRDVWTVRPDGSGLRNLTAGHDGWDGEPAWSPDGSRVAFSSDRAGDRDVWIVDAAGGQLRRVTAGRGREGLPFWISGGRLGFVRRTPEGLEVHEAILTAGTTRRLARSEATWWPDAVRRVGAPRRWIEAVRLPEELSRSSPGEWVRREAELRDASGSLVSPDAVPLRWTSSDTGVVDPDAGVEWMRVRGGGRAVLRVTAGGWRRDSVAVEVRPLRTTGGEPVLQDDWSDGLQEARWMPVGAPPPRVVDAGGRFPRALLNGGDENHHSGVVARRPLSASRGLTMEVWGRAPFSRPHYQALIVGLTPRPPGRDPGGWSEWGARGAAFELTLAGERPDSLLVKLTGGASHTVPAPADPGVWHRYSVQVDTAGRLSLVVDGRLHWRSPQPLDPARLDGSHLALYGRSRGARILHGPLRVFQTRRYHW